MARKHERIGVVKGQELGEALHDDAERRNELLRELADCSTSGDPPWDPSVLARIDELTTP